MPERGGGETRVRPMWSGTIAFGLVALPVSLYTAQRSSRVSLRMLGPEGDPLERRYFSSHDEAKELSDDDIVRGFPVGDGEFVLVEDEEIEALAPDKSMEIDLSRFVDLSEVDPTLFERGYFLAPDRGALKAYRLLARSMEEAQRAGIATFVMRGTEYLVAILAEDGLLRAQTLRFFDELRTPEDVGLPDLSDADATRVRAFARLIDALEAKRLDPELLRDEASRRLRELIASKLEAAGGAAVDDAGDDDAADAPDAETIDLMDVLKRSLAQDEDVPAADADAPAADAPADAAAAADDLDGLTRAELYERAQALDVPGRSSMNKAALVAALRERG